jgi:hypothetical protein
MVPFSQLTFWDCVTLWKNLCQKRLIETSTAMRVGAAVDGQFWQLIYGIISLRLTAGRAGIFGDDQPDTTYAWVCPQFFQSHCGS